MGLSDIEKAIEVGDKSIIESTMRDHYIDTISNYTRFKNLILNAAK
jgi:hypothetical protein